MTNPIPKYLLAVASLLLPTAMHATTQAAGLLVADGGFGGKLEIVQQEVHVTINNGIAVTQIDQVFRNTENRIVEALYTFPVPNGASVSNFSMIINGKEMIGEVVEKERAREIYSSYKTQRRDPGLLEQVDYKTFELRVFPIPAGAEQPIHITYYQQLDFDHNQATYVYPLATTTTGPVDATTKGKFAFTIDVKSEIPILQLVSPSHKEDFVISSVSANYTRASLEVTEGDLNRDVVIAYDVERPQTGLDLITSKFKNEDGYFLLSMTAGKELEELATGMDYVFVVDISGSMANDGKLTLSRAAVESFISALGAEDRFELMTFNTTPNLHFGELAQVSDANQQAAHEFLASQRAKGGTELRPAIETAYRYRDADRPLNVVVLSDGMTEVREQAELLAAIRSAAAGTRVFCIGIGNDINRPLLKQVAENAGGLAAFVSHQDDFQRQAQAFRRKLMRPVAANVKIEIEGVGSYDLTEDELPDLYFGAPIWLSGRYEKPGRGLITVSAEVLGQPFQQALEFEFPESNEQNPEIERMWAYQRVQGLMDAMRVNGKSNQQIDEIVRLCEGYSIVSEYASFLVLENDAEYARWSIQRRNATRVGKDRAAQAQLRKQLDSLRESSLAQLGPSKQQLVSTSSETGSSTPATTSQADASSPRTSTDPTINRPGDLNFDSRVRPSSGGSGGGAIDPITGLVAVGVAGASAWAARRRKLKQS
ncbi:MAG: VIT domain-containing protein [bacterium]|nr:VIT domain-containing protein [bacterium]